MSASIPFVMKKVRYCARCGGDHENLEAQPLAQPMAPDDAGGITWTHWAPCPTNGQPILVRLGPDDGPVSDDYGPRELRLIGERDAALKRAEAAEVDAAQWKRRAEKHGCNVVEGDVDCQ